MLLDLVAFLPVIAAIAALTWIGGGLARLGRDGSNGEDGNAGPSGWPRPTPAGPLPSAGPDDLARSA